MTTSEQRNVLAKVIVAIAVAGLLFLGLHGMTALPVYRNVHWHSPILEHRSVILILLSVVLAWFHEWAARRLIWLLAEIHRWISAIAVFGIVSAEAVMHMLSVPHLEGWWVPLLGGGVIMSATTAWLLRALVKLVKTSEPPKEPETASTPLPYQ